MGPGRKRGANRHGAHLAKGQQGGGGWQVRRAFKKVLAGVLLADYTPYRMDRFYPRWRIRSLYTPSSILRWYTPIRILASEDIR